MLLLCLSLSLPLSLPLSPPHRITDPPFLPLLPLSSPSSHRRLAVPTMSIVNDVILNKRVSLTDKEALKDAKRSLSAMLSDFLLQHRPKMPEAERIQYAQRMDMTPISEEYELELRRPIQNLLSGRIARLVLIQLQFVKKELLVAMQAIDELFNANQVNLQLLAVTPAFFSILALQRVARGTVNLIKSTSRGRFVESTAVVHQTLRQSVRDLERLFITSNGYYADYAAFDSSSGSSPGSGSGQGGWEDEQEQGQGQGQRQRQGQRHISPLDPSTGAGTGAGPGSALAGLPDAELGRLLALLHRIHHVLVFNSSHFDETALKQLQEDLRDLVLPFLSVRQRLVIVQRIIRHNAFLQARQRSVFS